MDSEDEMGYADLRCCAVMVAQAPVVGRYVKILSTPVDVTDAQRIREGPVSSSNVRRLAATQKRPASASGASSYRTVGVGVAAGKIQTRRGRPKQR